MTNSISRFVLIAITTVDTPASAQGTLPAMTHVVAIGMLIAERDAEDRWDFTLKHHAIGAGDSEDLLLAWAARVMPDTAIVIGWQLADAIVMPLLEAGKDAEPGIARGFLDRLTKLVTMPSVDLAISHGGAGAPAFVDVAAAHGINVAPLSDTEAESAWAFGDVDALRSDVAQRTIAAWRLWLAEANGAGTEALAAFETWVLNT
jgi:hypothetical protein